jgi:glycosyltransferase involved in cell wall biosynthesis
MGIETATLRPLPGDRDAARGAFGVPAKAFAVAFLGRLVPIKGADILIDALPPGATLLVGGDGPERGRLERRAAERGLEARFLGPLDAPHRRRLLAAADALAVCSRALPDGRTEGTPTVLLEALAAGLPVVATATGGAPLLLADTPGAGAAAGRCLSLAPTGGRLPALFVPPDDAPALKAALELLRRDPVLGARLRAAGPEAASRYDWDVLAPRLLDQLSGLNGA